MSPTEGTDRFPAIFRDLLEERFGPGPYASTVRTVDDIVEIAMQARWALSVQILGRILREPHTGRILLAVEGGEIGTHYFVVGEMDWIRATKPDNEVVPEGLWGKP